VAPILPDRVQPGRANQPAKQGASSDPSVGQICSGDWPPKCPCQKEVNDWDLAVKNSVPGFRELDPLGLERGLSDFKARRVLAIESSLAKVPAPLFT
jgi:hypothetical protein